MEKSRHSLSVASLAPLVALLAAVGCATAGDKAASSGPRKNLAAADYYPLAVGWKWAYDVEKDGQTIFAPYSVLERFTDTAVVQAGEERLIYAITPAGIAQKEGPELGDYVIKNPVTVGTGWPVAGGTAKVLSVSGEVTVAAGHFTDCAVVEVTRADPLRVLRTTFAPEVGPVALELQVQQGGSFVTVTRARLRTVTRPGEDLFQSTP